MFPNMNMIFPTPRFSLFALSHVCWCNRGLSFILKMQSIILSITITTPWWLWAENLQHVDQNFSMAFVDASCKDGLSWYSKIWCKDPLWHWGSKGFMYALGYYSFIKFPHFQVWTVSLALGIRGIYSLSFWIHLALVFSISNTVISWIA